MKFFFKYLLPVLLLSLLGYMAFAAPKSEIIPAPTGTAVYITDGGGCITNNDINSTEYASNLLWCFNQYKNEQRIKKGQCDPTDIHCDDISVQR